MPRFLRRLGAATAVLSLVVGGLVVLTATEAGAATIDVPCGNNAALDRGHQHGERQRQRGSRRDQHHRRCRAPSPSPRRRSVSSPGEQQRRAAGDLGTARHQRQRRRARPQQRGAARPRCGSSSSFNTAVTLNDLTIAGGNVNYANSVGGGVAVTRRLAHHQPLVHLSGTSPRTGGGVYALGAPVAVERLPVQQNSAFNGGGARRRCGQRPPRARPSVRGTAFVLNAALANSAARRRRQRRHVRERHVLVQQRQQRQRRHHRRERGRRRPDEVPGHGHRLQLDVRRQRHGAGRRRRPGLVDPHLRLDLRHPRHHPCPVVTVKNTIIHDSDSAAASPVIPASGPIPAYTASPCNTALGGTITDAGGNFEYPSGQLRARRTSTRSSRPPASNGHRPCSPVAFGSFNFRLLPTSPAIDAAVAGCPSTDQRGKPRPGGDAAATAAPTRPSRRRPSRPGRPSPRRTRR